MLRKTLPATLLISIILSVVSADAPLGPDGEPLTIEALRGELEDFGYELAEAYYLMDAYGEEVDTDPIFQRYAHLDDPALTVWLHSLEDDATDPVLARSYRYLVKDLEDDQLWFSIDELYNDYLATEAAGMIKAGDEEIADELGFQELTPIPLIERLVQEEAATRPAN